MGGQAYLGVDIGGQSIKGFRLEADGTVSLRSVRPTPAARGAGAVLAALGELLTELDAPGPAVAVGVGTPGGVDAVGRIAGVAVKIPGWKGVELAAEVARLARAPAFVRNDGNLAAYAEWAVRLGSSKALLFVGLGTGIGGGFIEDGRILGGVDDKAVEIGHVIVYPEG
ncbi:MAG: ROK family protein, partial [Spirochaetaceae bacterium]|nr:ROK family protein [Spirochaetaceae bacterium]